MKIDEVGVCSTSYYVKTRDFFIKSNIELMDLNSVRRNVIMSVQTTL